MSYYTFTDFSLDDADRPAGRPSKEEILAVAEKYLAGIDWPLDALLDLKEGLENGGRVYPGFVDLRNVEIIHMFCAISAAFPGLRLFVRGLGEEHADIWAAEIVDGDIVEQHGPFDD
jgi:hypothetical protein